MSKIDSHATLSLEGRFLGFEFEDRKPKRLRLLTADGEWSVKLAKEVRATLRHDLPTGAWMQVVGKKKINHKTGEVTLKAYRVDVELPEQAERLLPTTPQKPATSATILVCQKSDCMKRGGKAVCQALEAALSDRDLTEQVKIQGTGCMKQCKAGPNLVFMPGKTYHTRVSARDVGVLVDEYFSHAPCLE